MCDDNEKEEADSVRRRSRRILAAALLAAALVVAALGLAVVFASFPYSPSEQKCGEVYGHGNSRIGINDADDCLGRDAELRDDGQFRSTKQHCNALARDAVRKDVRCQKAKRAKLLEGVA